MCRDVESGHVGVCKKSWQGIVHECLKKERKTGLEMGKLEDRHV